MSNIISEFSLSNGVVVAITAEMVAKDVLDYITDFYLNGKRLTSKDTVLAALDKLKKNVEENFYTKEEIAEQLADMMVNNPLPKSNESAEKSVEIAPTNDGQYYADWINTYYKTHPDIKKKMETRYFNTTIKPVKDILTKLNELEGE